MTDIIKIIILKAHNFLWAFFLSIIINYSVKFKYKIKTSFADVNFKS